jgi:isoquinoline 1-oxidoreductase beta subunit
MPQTTSEPGGAGEFGVAATMAAVACAYRKATGKMPTEFPINHGDALDFEPFPTFPSIPQSPTDGLKKAGVKRPRKKKKATKKKTTAKKKGN